MMEKIKNLIIVLTEELKYRENILQFCKGLETTLWGLEEQANFPENSAQTDQEQLNQEINNQRIKLSNCRKLLDAHEVKVKELLKSYVTSEASCNSCNK